MEAFFLPVEHADGARLCIHHPPAGALPALIRAREAGLDVTAGISIHHLTLNEFDVGDYRTFYRFTPPLRSEEDRQAMVQAVA
ncbi:MAG: dihydroorotase, partial [Aquincola tertiaricarbonis]